MNILYINHYAGSPQLGMEYRPYYLAREWVRIGHRVMVVAASYSHVRGRQPEVGASPRNETLDGINYRWLPTPSYRGNDLGRAWNILCFLWQLWREAPRLAQEFAPDAVIASSTYPMDIWVARRLARLARPRAAKLIFEVHDLWPLSPIELSGMSPHHPLIRLCQWAEDAAYRHADVVISILPKVHTHMAAHGLDLRKLALVPNGISIDDWAGISQPLRDDVAQALDDAQRQKHSVVGYTGGMGLPNALDTLLDAAKLVTNLPVTFILLGDGMERERLAARIAQETIGNVKLLAPIAKSQIPSFLGAIDVAYIGWRRAPIYRFGISPNKLMDYMMAGCAVLHAVQAGNDPVAESGCGVTVEPESAPAVADGLRRLLALSAPQRKALGACGREFVLAHHSYAVLAQRFLEAVAS